MAAITEKIVGATGRRTLAFSSFEEVLDDVRRMRNTPHRTLGQWSLAQVCRHLGSTFHASIDGIKLSGSRLRRFLFGRKFLAWTFKNGMPKGITVDRALNPPLECDVDESIRSLEDAIQRYQAHTGTLKPHPIFGKLPRTDWDRLHLFHCAHHLSFVVSDASA